MVAAIIPGLGGWRIINNSRRPPEMGRPVRRGNRQSTAASAFGQNGAGE